MSWQTVDLSTVNPNMEILPAKAFTFELLPGAKFDERDPSTIVTNFAVVNDGEFTGRRIYVNYKDGEEKAVKRLEQAMGIEAQPGETALDYLTRAAGGRVTFNVTHSKVTDEYPNPKAFVAKWNPKPAA